VEIGMGKRDRQRKLRESVFDGKTECIYCGNPADTIDHMPPKQFFPGKIRPKGMEYRCCSTCNSATKGAEAVASFISKISMDDDYFDWGSPQGERQLHALVLNAPSTIIDLFGYPKEVYMENAYYAFTRFMIVELNRDNVASHLDVFSAKLGLALFFEHTRTALPSDGAVFSFWMSNKEAAARNAESMFNILPGYSTIKNGKNTAESTFGYRYNTNGKSIIASMSYFNESLYIANVAFTSEFSQLEILLMDKFGHFGSASILRKGELATYKRSGGGS
jgi:hypothetical protein